MLSRVADSLYWMSRYIERAENDARILDVNLQLLLDLGDEAEAMQHWTPVIVSLEETDLFDSLYDMRAPAESITTCELKMASPSFSETPLTIASESVRAISCSLGTAPSFQVVAWARITGMTD